VKWAHKRCSATCRCKRVSLCMYRLLCSSCANFRKHMQATRIAMQHHASAAAVSTSGVRKCQARREPDLIAYRQGTCWERQGTAH